MSIPCHEYELQIEKVQETVTLLNARLGDLRIKLETSPDDATYRRELKQLNLDMKITMNELEHAQNSLQSCHTKSERLQSV